jgi:hypothetical protein
MYVQSLGRGFGGERLLFHSGCGAEVADGKVGSLKRVDSDYALYILLDIW